MMTNLLPFLFGVVSTNIESELVSKIPGAHDKRYSHRLLKFLFNSLTCIQYNSKIYPIERDSSRIC